jgi:hypothetical protein
MDLGFLSSVDYAGEFVADKCNEAQREGGMA